MATIQEVLPIMKINYTCKSVAFSTFRPHLFVCDEQKCCLKW